MDGPSKESRRVAIRFRALLAAPVFTTAQGKGAVPEDHPLAVGNRWTGEPELIKLLGEADVLLVGTRSELLNAAQTST